ncbi:unnamed protein product [Cunninghamella echinulata]
MIKKSSSYSSTLLVSLLLLFILLPIQSIHGYAVRPTATPSPTKTSIIPKEVIVAKVKAVPTNAPHPALVKRTLKQTLSLFQDWHSICNEKNDNIKVVDSGNDNNNNPQANVQLDIPLQQLWKTVTTTVNCGNGHVKTVTKTVTATTTATATETVDGNEPFFKCTDECWNSYLWRTYGDSITVAQGFTGITLMIIGLYLAIFGYRFFRPTMGFIGFIFFATMTWIGLVNNEPEFGYVNNEIVYICVSCGIGIIGALIFMFAFPIALYFVGAVCGIFFAIFVMSWKESLVIQIKIARICFIVGMGVVWAFALYLLECYIVILSTSFIGAYLFIMGLDFFAHTGFLNSWRLIFDGNPTHVNIYIMGLPTYIMLSFVIVLCLISAGWQYYWNIMTLKRRFGVNVVEKKDDEK